MSNTVSNILTINGTEDQVAKVRDFIKGSKGESISFQSIIPMPVELTDGLDRMMWKYMHWGTKWDANAVYDGAVDAPNHILFNTQEATPILAMIALSSHFPDVTFSVIFSDEYPGLFAGEYTLFGGKWSKRGWYSAFDNNCCSIDQAMEYYFRTHEYEREYWKKDDDGEWCYIDDEE